MRGEYRKLNSSHIFVHVAKNGGGSVFEYLHDCPNVIVPFGAHKISVAMVLAVNRSAIVALRDPADRVISEYQWSALDLGKDYDDHVRRSHIRAHDTVAPGTRWNMSHLGTLLSHARANLKPQVEKLGGARLEDPRVNVLCTERLTAGLEHLSRKLCAHRNSSMRAVPWLHRTQATGEGLHYNMTKELRQALLRAYAQDSELHQRFCAGVSNV